MKTIIAVAVVMMMPAFAFGQISKCLDKNGKVVGYGNDCPAGTRAEASGVKSTPAAPSAPSAGAGTPSKSLAERDAEFRKRQIEKQEGETKAQKTAAEGAQRERACNDARANLKSLQAGNRITRVDPKTGERNYLSDSEYAPEIARTQQLIQSNCK